MTALEKPNIVHLKEYTAIASKFLSLDNENYKFILFFTEVIPKNEKLMILSNSLIYVISYGYLSLCYVICKCECSRQFGLIETYY